MAMNRNKPSSTDVGIRVSGVGSMSRDNAINRLESKPDSLVSLTFTMLKMISCNIIMKQEEECFIRISRVGL